MHQALGEAHSYNLLLSLSANQSINQSINQSMGQDRAVNLFRKFVECFVKVSQMLDEVVHGGQHVPDELRFAHVSFARGVVICLRSSRIRV